jgi:hypothetical protein
MTGIFYTNDDESAGDAGIESAPGVVSFTLKTGQERFVKSAGVRIKLLEVAEDSRCPQGVNCIWAGNVRVVVRISGDGRSARSETLNSATEPRAVQVKKKYLSISKVMPPKIIDREIKPQDYIITLTVSSRPASPQGAETADLAEQ